MRSHSMGLCDRFEAVMQLNMGCVVYCGEACDPNYRPLGANDPIVTLEQRKTVIASGWPSFASSRYDTDGVTLGLLADSYVRPSRGDFWVLRVS
jgi:hypothetical protein